MALVGSIYMSGLFFGSFIFGYLGDRFGRKISLMLSVLVSGCLPIFIDLLIIYSLGLAAVVAQSVKRLGLRSPQKRRN